MHGGTGFLPWHDRDPFDRIHISHALANNLAIVTPDTQMAKYGLKPLWWEGVHPCGAPIDEQRHFE